MVSSDGRPCAARNIVGTVVTSSSSMMRGLVRATYARTTASAERAADTCTTAGLVGATSVSVLTTTRCHTGQQVGRAGIASHREHAVGNVDTKSEDDEGEGEPPRDRYAVR